MKIKGLFLIIKNSDPAKVLSDERDRPFLKYSLPPAGCLERWRPSSIYPKLLWGEGAKGPPNFLQ